MPAGVNLNKLRVEFDKKLFNTNQFKGLAQGIAQRRVNVAQGSMVNAFEEHAVTREMEGGADYAGPSVVKYFRSDVKANLYSFVGFPKGTNPVELLRKLLKFPIQVKLQTRIQGTYYFAVLSPSSEDIEKATPLPDDYYSGDFSWARAVEEGDGASLGIGQFLAIRVSASRSGGGIQVEDMSPQDSEIEATPYISAILEAFRVKLEQLSS